MAKKSRNKLLGSEENWIIYETPTLWEKISKFPFPRINYNSDSTKHSKIWSCGVAQSFCFNTIVLLLLALFVIEPPPKVKPISIIMSFGEVENTPEISDSVLDLKITDDIVSTNNGPEEELAIAGNNEPEPEGTTEELVEEDSPTIAKQVEETEQTSIEVESAPILADTITKPTGENTSEETTDSITSLNTAISGLGLDKEPAPAPVSSRGNRGRLSNGNGMSGSGNTNGGDDMQRRLAEAGARTGDIQISIAWDDINDIDVGVLIRTDYGASAMINFQNRIGPNTGMLDIDANAMPSTNRPVENIFWPTNSAPKAHYIVYIHHYRQWCQVHRTNVRIRIKVDGKISEQQIQIAPEDGLVNVFAFDYGR